MGIKILLAILLIASIAVMPDIDTPTEAIYDPVIIAKASQQIITPEPQATIKDASLVSEPLPIAKIPEKPATEPTEHCGPHDPKIIYNMLIEIGVPHVSAIQQLGSWKTESQLNQCQQWGDGGIAWGLNSWHPGRRQDMPTELRAQVRWAIHTEMKRDCLSCYNTFMAGQDVASIRQAIQESTRWGVRGDRWLYADQYMQNL